LDHNHLKKETSVLTERHNTWILGSSSHALKSQSGKVVNVHVMQQQPRERRTGLDFISQRVGRGADFGRRTEEKTLCIFREMGRISTHS
jgi:hypothetical protein